MKLEIIKLHTTINTETGKQIYEADAGHDEKCLTCGHIRGKHAWGEKCSICKKEGKNCKKFKGILKSYEKKYISQESLINLLKESMTPYSDDVTYFCENLMKKLEGAK